MLSRLSYDPQFSFQRIETKSKRLIRPQVENDWKIQAGWREQCQRSSSLHLLPPVRNSHKTPSLMQRKPSKLLRSHRQLSTHLATSSTSFLSFMKVPETRIEQSLAAGIEHGELYHLIDASHPPPGHLNRHHRCLSHRCRHHLLCHCHCLPRSHSCDLRH